MNLIQIYLTFILVVEVVTVIFTQSTTRQVTNCLLGMIVMLPIYGRIFNWW